MNNKGIIVEVTAFMGSDAWKGRKPRAFGLWGRLELEWYDGKRLVDKLEKPIDLRPALSGPMQKMIGERLMRYGSPAHSFLQNYAKIIRGFIQGLSSTNESLTDSGGAAREARIVSGALTGDNVPPVGQAGDIGFGSSNAALDSTQFELQGIILGKAPVTTTVIVENAVQDQWKHEGQVVNTTGGPFSVQEVGLYANLRDAVVGGAPIRQIMTMRDIVNPAVVVADGLTVQGRYTFTAAV